MLVRKLGTFCEKISVFWAMCFLYNQNKKSVFLWKLTLLNTLKYKAVKVKKSQICIFVNTAPDLNVINVRQQTVLINYYKLNLKK